jgi:hypothetical protein
MRADRFHALSFPPSTRLPASGATLSTEPFRCGRLFINMPGPLIHANHKKKKQLLQDYDLVLIAANNLIAALERTKPQAEHYYGLLGASVLLEEAMLVHAEQLKQMMKIKHQVENVIEAVQDQNID